MAEYIDRHALKNDGHICWHDGKGNVFYEVDHAPIADVVEVVRCKDCKNYEPNKIDPQELGGYCIFHDDLVWHNGYCENGCRKGDDNG